MVASSGLSAQLGIAEESTYGTYLAPTSFHEFVDEGVKYMSNRIESAGIRNGRRIGHRWTQGTRKAEGPINLELANETAGIWLKHCFGAVSTSGASDPYTHTITPGAIDGKSLMCQIVRPDIGGTDRVFSYLGGKIKSWEISSAIDEYVKLGLDMWFSDEDVAQSAGSASFDDGPPFHFADAWAEVGGTEVPVIGWSIKGDNGLAVDRWKHRDVGGSGNGRVAQEPLESGRRTFEGSIELDFDWTQYNNFRNGSEVALVFDMARSLTDDRLTITTNARYDGETPNVGGDELLSHTIPFKVTGTPSGTDAAAITATLINGVASL